MSFYCLAPIKNGGKCNHKVDDFNSFCWQHEKKGKIKPIEKLHKCSIEECRKLRSKGLYCNQHMCLIKECDKMQASNGVFCISHKCAQLGCQALRFYTSDNCAKHACFDHECKGVRLHGSKWCINHLCKKEDCKFKGCDGYCPLHKCAVEGCMKPRRTEWKTRYCSAHGCAVNKCWDVIDSTSREGKYCIYHKKKYRLEKPDECAVCLEDLEANEEPWECGHYIHKSCIVRSSKAKCPMCRCELEIEVDEFAFSYD